MRDQFYASYFNMDMRKCLEKAMPKLEGESVLDAGASCRMSEMLLFDYVVKPGSMRRGSK
jgi:hypothetical protein